MTPTIVKSKKSNTLFTIKIADFISDQEMAIAKQRFKTEQGVVEFIVDFCDYVNIFGMDLKPENVRLAEHLSVFDVVTRAVVRIRNILRHKDCYEITSYKVTPTAVFVIVSHGVIDNARIGNV